MRGRPLLFVGWPTGAGRGGGQGSLEMETSGEPRRRWPLYLSFPLPLSPRASAAAVFYFNSTWRGPEHRRRAGGCPGFWDPFPSSSDPRQARADTHSRRTHPSLQYARPLPSSQGGTSAHPCSRGMHAQKARTSPGTLRRGPSQTIGTRGHTRTYTDACYSFPTHFQYWHTDTRASVHAR